MDVRRTATMLLVALPLVAGCGDEGDSAAAPVGVAEVRDPLGWEGLPRPAALADGVVTFEEYDDAVHAFVECMAEIPIEVLTGGLNEIRVYEDLAMRSDRDPYEIPEAQPCVAAFEPVSEHWQYAAADAFEERYGIGHDELALRRCLEIHGLPWHEGMTEVEMTHALMAAAATDRNLVCDL